MCICNFESQQNVYRSSVYHSGASEFLPHFYQKYGQVNSVLDSNSTGTSQLIQTVKFVEFL